MYSSNLENQLIIVDIVDALQDRVSIQIDIDETKVKAAELVAQQLDLKRLIGADNVKKCLEDDDNFNEELRELVIPALCYFTYARCLKMFQGTFTDSGFMTEGEALDKNTAKAVSNEMSSIAETFMEDVIDWLEEQDEDDPQVDEARENLNPRIRTFGGEEWRATN